MFRGVTYWMRRLAVPACLLAIGLGAAGPALADKLIVFKNGKTIRAKSVKEEKGWTRLELDGGNSLGVRTAQVLTIEETSGGGAAKADLPNRAAAGGGGGGGGAAYASSGPAYSPRSAEAQIEEAPPPPEEPPPQAPPSPAVGGVQGGQGGVPGIPLSPVSQPSGRGMRRFSRSGANSALSNPRQQVTDQSGMPAGRIQPLVKNQPTEDDEDE